MHCIYLSADVIRNQSALGRFAFDDPQLQDTIAEICVAHGLDRKELEDPIAYPTLLRELRGENVNVRLLAVLLRLWPSSGSWQGLLVRARCYSMLQVR